MNENKYINSEQKTNYVNSKNIFTKLERSPKLKNLHSYCTGNSNENSEDKNFPNKNKQKFSYDLDRNVVNDNHKSFKKTLGKEKVRSSRRKNGKSCECRIF